MSDSFLSQEEVDALLEGVTGESQKSDAGDVDEANVRNYDISSQERIVRGRMPTMEIVNERFARNFRIGLFHFIRRSLRLLLISSRAENEIICDRSEITDIQYFNEYAFLIR